MGNMYNLISIVSFSLAGLFFALAVFMWFRFSILKIINDLSGRTEKMEIERIKASRETASANTAESLLDGTSQVSGFVKRRGGNITLDLENQADTMPTSLLVENETEILDDNETELLDNNTTEVLIEEADLAKIKAYKALEEKAVKASEFIGFKITDSIDLYSSDITVD